MGRLKGFIWQRVLQFILLVIQTFITVKVHPKFILSLLVFTLQVLQGGGLESPTKPKGRPKKNSIPSSEQLSEQERSAAEPHSEGSSSHLESTQEEWPDHSPHILWLYMQKLWNAQCVSFRWGPIPKRTLERMWRCALTWTASCQLQRLTHSAENWTVHAAIFQQPLNAAVAPNMHSLMVNFLLLRRELFAVGLPFIFYGSILTHLFCIPFVYYV